MTMSPIVRVRVLGSIVIVLAFVAGIVTGMAIERRLQAEPGLQKN